MVPSGPPKPINSQRYTVKDMMKKVDFPAKIDVRWRVQIPHELREKLDEVRGKTVKITVEEI